MIRGKTIGFLILIVVIFSSPFTCEIALAESRKASIDAPLMRFNWPSSGMVKVTEKSQRKGTLLEFQYKLEITPNEKNKAIQIRYRDFEVLSVNGEKTPMMAEITQQWNAVSGMAGYKVDSNGKLLKVFGLEASIIKQLNKKGVAEDRKKTMKKLLSNPNMLATMEAIFAQSWNSWVGLWIDFPDKVGASYPVKAENVAFGHKVSLDVLYEQLAIQKNERKRKVKLRMTSEVDANDIKTALFKYFTMLSAGSKSPKEIVDMIVSAEKIGDVEIITDPYTLMPDKVTTRSIVKIKLEGKKQQEQIETHEYVFDWSNVGN